MAGGVWSSQNKVRPGAYINFETDNIISAEVGTRGIVTMAMELNWGAEGKLIELTSEELYNGDSLAKIGLLPNDDNALLLKLALQNAQTLKLFRLNKNGVKASKQLISYDEYNLTTDTELVSGKTYYTRSGAGTTESPYVYTEVQEPDVSAISTYYEKTSYGLTATAKYPGTFGNKIAIVITTIGETNVSYNVQTYADGYLVDTQTIKIVDEIKNNDFVIFEGNCNLSAISSTLLVGGTNGDTITDYEDYFEALVISRWNTMAVPVDDGTIQDNVITFIRTMRESEGKYVQAVIANHGGVDYEGIINNICGIAIDDFEITAAQFTAWVAGATAGADINESLTGKIVTDATSIINAKTSEEIIDGLKKGHFLLSLNQDGAIKVEKDINSLHTFNQKSYIFSKNRVIRELDEIGSGIARIWENTYLGKVSNDENGRVLFKSSIIDFLTELRNQGGIDEFDTEGITVDAGENIDAVVATLAVKPLDSMEFLYMTVDINQE